jgi:beta-lactam-binding protein with PASTA domain
MRSRSNLSTLVAAAFALAGCAELIPSSTSSSLTGGRGRTSAAAAGDVVVPDLIGKTPEEAAVLVADAGFTQAIESTRPVECYDAPEVDGRINCQSPAPGETVRSYTVVQINVYRTQRIAGAVVRAQLLALIGMTPDQARSALASYGHDGIVSVELRSEYDDDCGDGRVCGFNVPESGMGVHDSIKLYVNPPAD